VYASCIDFAVLHFTTQKKQEKQRKPYQNLDHWIPFLSGSESTALAPKQKEKGDRYRFFTCGGSRS